jgi:hypothetical protein
MDRKQFATFFEEMRKQFPMGRPRRDGSGEKKPDGETGKP